MRSIIVLGSANGSRNLGDECMWESLVDFLRNKFPEVSITTDAIKGWTPPFGNINVLPMLANEMKVDPTRNPWFARALPKSVVARGLSRIGRNSRVERLVRDRIEYGPKTPLEKEWYERIKECDGLFISGAGGMTDQYSVHGIFSWWLLSAWANKFGKPVFAVGQGIGPIADQKLLGPLSEMINCFDYLGVRETKSLEFARSLAPAHKNIDQTLDWALGIHVEPADREQAKIIADELLSGQSYIALSLHLHQPLALLRKRKLQKAAESIVKQAAAAGLKTLFVPNMTGVGHCDDRALADSIISNLPKELRDSCAVHRAQSDARTVRALLHNATGLFTTRYHPLVFSLTEGKPVIGLFFDKYYQQKLSGASALFEVTSNTAEITKVTSDPQEYFQILDNQQVTTMSEEFIEENLFTPLAQAMKNF